MTVDNINVEETVKRVDDLIAQEKNLSLALKASLEKDKESNLKSQCCK